MAIEWHVGDVVRKLREQRRWGQTKLATSASLNRATIVSVEENTPGTKRETYEKIARALGLSLGELFSMVPKGAQSITPGAPFQGAAWDGTTERRSGQDRRAAANDE